MSESKVQILKNHNLRKTDFRMKVLDIFLRHGDHALSNAGLEAQLEEFDRITLYRTLKSFEKAGIIHQAIDSSNDTKYALCQADCSSHHHQDNHAHFLCTQCGNTYCIDNVVNTDYTLPRQFRLDKVHIALEGRCDQCTSI